MNMKFCNTCKIEKPADAFSPAAKHKGCRLGLRSRCKACTSKKSLEYQSQHKSQTEAYRKEYYWKNADKFRENARQWAANNKHRRVVNQTMRTRVQQNQTASWADPDAIMAIYERAAQIRALGLNVHVDHIVPLTSDKVCGLHCEDNLEIIYASDNIAKSNRWWPGDFEHQQEITHAK